MGKKLYKSLNDRKISGVCGGFAEYFNVDSTLIRLLTLLLILFSCSTALIFYIACAIIMPEQNQIG